MRTDRRTDIRLDMTKVKLLTNLLSSHTDSLQSLVCVRPYKDSSVQPPKKFHTTENFTNSHLIINSELISKLNTFQRTSSVILCYTLHPKFLQVLLAHILQTERKGH